MLLVLFVAFCFSLFHSISHWLFKDTKEHHGKFLSLSAGILLTLVLLVLLPELFSIMNSSLVLMLLLAGFSLFHIVEKLFYKKYTKKRLEDKLAKLHLIGIGIDKLSIGFILVFLVPSFANCFIILPLFVHTFSLSIVLHHFHENYKNKIFRFFVVSATFIGALIAFYLRSEQVLFNIMLALSSGILLFLVTRDIIPPQKEGNPLYFVVGVLLVILSLAF